MTHDDVEWTRESFDPARLLAARSASWDLLEACFARIAVGMRSDEARAAVDELIVARTGRKPWHPTQLRVDHETRLPFGAKPERLATVGPRSLVLLDMGPVVDGYEGDVARTGRLDGSEDPLGQAARALHEELVLHWRLHRPSGRALYTFAAARADALGFDLATRGASGHRLADFPHEVRGHLKTLDRCPRGGAWVLEVHLLSRHDELGAFYEDLLV
jgi:Xaa-Pro aminopeptidase